MVRALANKKGNNDTVNVIGRGNGRAMLTVSQVAESLNVHPHSVRRWADSGMLNCYRIGFRGDRRFKPEDVDEFLDARLKKRA